MALRITSANIRRPRTHKFSIDCVHPVGQRWRALTLPETVEVADGALDIDVTASSNNGVLSGISINELVV